MSLNFAQPLWLWGLLAIPSGWLWGLLNHKLGKANTSGVSKFIDANLLPHILVSNGNRAQRNYVGILYSLLFFCIIMALANPRWSYRDLDAFQPTASMVILLDLSTTMNATDVSPSRIIRARQSIEDLLNLSKGLKIGLIGFAGHPHLISPITDDIQTIKTYIPALDTDLTNVQGNSLHSSLRMAADLLASEPGEQKSILLVSDGNLVSSDFSQELKTLGAHNIQVHVLGVGTTAGSPFKNKNGSLHKTQGKVVTSKLNDTLLKSIAKQGHGIYTEATHNDIGIKAILAKSQKVDLDNVVAGKVRQWDDSYYLFLIPAAAILLYLMRQRVLYLLILGICCSWYPGTNVYASTFMDSFRNSEQRGQQSYVDGNFKQAAERFKDPYHKGVALYRDGQFAEAEKQFKLVDRADVKTSALYNAGNSQMQQKKWRAAIKSYEAVLSEEPQNFAAQHNLEIARKMLAENDDQDEEEQEQEQDKQDKDCECDNKDKSANGKDSDAQNKQSKDQNKDQSTNADEQRKEQQQQQSKQDELDSQDSKQAEASAAEKTPGDDQESNNSEQKQLKAMQQMAEDEARLEQWLNRVDSDIKVFLKNKFYVEDVLSAQ